MNILKPIAKGATYVFSAGAIAGAAAIGITEASLYYAGNFAKRHKIATAGVVILSGIYYLGSDNLKNIRSDISTTMTKIAQNSEHNTILNLENKIDTITQENIGYKSTIDELNKNEKNLQKKENDYLLRINNQDKKLEELRTTLQQQYPQQQNTQIQQNAHDKNTDDNIDKNKYIIYTIQAGDTLSKISKKVYGDWNLATSIAKANEIRDLDNIKVGAEIKIPRLVKTNSPQ